MEGIDKENPKLIFWGEVIKESGIETEHIKKLLKLLTTSAAPRFFLGQFRFEERPEPAVRPLGIA